MNNSKLSRFSGFEIAIVGMSARFPGARNVDEFWQNLRDGVESISFFTEQELKASGIASAVLRDPRYVRARPVLEDADQFDASFFGFNPREAELTDPQHRLFLECAWEALENAGYDSERYSGSIGVYAGVGATNYWLYNLVRNPEINKEGGYYQVFIGNDKDFMATRVSYKLNLRGASVVIQTACSTSLVAIHLASQSLLSGTCDMALAGGVAVHGIGKGGYFYQEGLIASPDGHCRAFDAQAQGTVFGSGVGVVVLKRLADALSDGDYIHAIIKGSAVNNDGALRIGYTAPSVDGQAQVIRMAHFVSEVEAESISYIETHGTGTPLGDPIEIAALTEAFRASTCKKGFCAIGSVKTNIGHLDAAAGVASLIKTVLALEHKLVPPSLHFKEPNPKIDFENSPFYVNAALAEWRTDGSPRRAGVSSFGIGGTNAHIILEQAPEVEPSGPTRPWQLLMLSAKTNTALQAACANLTEYLQHSYLNLADVAYTLQMGRRAMDHRWMAVCRDRDEAMTALQANDSAQVLTPVQESVERSVVFMFSGQGAQYVNMAQELYRFEPIFREQVDYCSEQLEPHLGLNLCKVLYPSADSGQASSQEREAMIKWPEQTNITQPALFVAEYALAKLWMEWGIHPQAMIGHSIGEYVAACLAGVFSLEDALALVAARGRLMQQMPKGAMLAVRLTESEVLPLLNPQLSLSAVNGPSLCVVSGVAEVIEELEYRLGEQGTACQALHTSHAFHSAMMDPILEPFTQQIKNVRLNAPQIPYISNVTGTWITAAEATDPTYWAQHLRRPVRFAEGLHELKAPGRVLLEVGPGQALSTLARQHPDTAAEQLVLSSLPHPQSRQSDLALLLQSLGQLWLAGVQVNWSSFYAQERRHRVPLPTYPFERRRYWIETEQGPAIQPISSKDPHIADWFYIPSWKRTMPPVQESQETRKSWLMFSNGDGLSAKLRQRLQAQGQVVTVLTGEQFAVHDDTYTIRPAYCDDYTSLLAALQERDQSPTHIVHLWNVASPPTQVGDFTEKVLQHSFYSLLFLAQAIGKRNPSEDLELVIISSNLHLVASGEIIQPEKALLLGPCRVIPQEMPHLTCRSVDIVQPEAESSAEAQLVEQLIAELGSNTQDRSVAYRGCDRWVQTYEPASLGEVKEKVGPRLREKGVYLITGGLGGIGLTLADYLARTVQAKLVLTTRSRFPEPQTWEQWLVTHDPKDRTSERIRAVQALEKLGAEVCLVQANVADRDQMQAAVHVAGQRFGSVHGVIHAAGVPGGGIIQLKTEQAAASVLAPKVQGTQVLAALFRDAPLDFFVLCSSITALTGGVGQVDYCAANAFMDAFARMRREQADGAIVSVNWDTWTSVGMAVNTPTNYSVERVEQSPPTIAVDHPLITDSYQEATGRTIYRMRFSPAEHWVLSEHILMGIPTIPGTTFLELARAAFADRTQNHSLEFREVIFPTPLMVSQGDSKEAQLIFEQQADGFHFRVVSKAGVAASGEPLWQTHAVGQIGSITGDAPQPYDMEAIRARCNTLEAVVATGEAESSAARFFEFGPRWTTTLKQAAFGRSEGLVLLELDKQFTPDMEGFKLHPALLDVATGSGSALCPDQRYIPLSYECMRVYASLPGKFYSYMRLKSNSIVGGKTITFQVTLLDEKGRVLVEIKEFTLKQIDPVTAFRLQSGAGDESQPIGHDLRDDGRDAILPQEGIEVFQRILRYNQSPQIVVSTRHLPTLIQQARQYVQAHLASETVSTKVRKARHPRPRLQNPYVAPRDDVEEKLTGILQQLLSIESVGIQDNFFEMGGHSLLAIQALSGIRQSFQVELSLHELFEAPTVAELAQRIKTANLVKQELPTLPVRTVSREEQLLANLDTLSDQQVSVLLANMLAEEKSKKTHE